MQCIQKTKTGTKCTNSVAYHKDYEGYCKYHINRFIQNKDSPTPFVESNPPPIEVVDDIINQIPEHRQINIPFAAGVPIFQFSEDELDQLIDFNIGERLRVFINAHRDEIFPAIEGKTNDQKDVVIFDIIIRSTQEEQNLLIGNYEKLLELINQFEENMKRNTPMPPAQLPNQFRQNQGILLNAILGALGLNQPAEPPQNRLRRDNLGDFVKDSENVHTKELVDPVMETAKKLIKFASKIPDTQDTFKEVIYECKLSDNARKQLAYMFFSDEKIYNLKAPTYRLVLEGLWFYTLKQNEENKKGIICRLSQELEDNYGSCPAGNLSRLVNVLSGYMEGIEVKYEESLQDAMARISGITDKSKRIQEAREVLSKKKVPEAEWKIWLEALEDD